MEKLFLNIQKLSNGFAMIAKVVLLFSVLLTVIDVIGRSLGRPVLGTYELVAFSSCIVFAFSLPLTSSVRAHIIVDLIMPSLSPATRKIFRLVHKCAGTGLFFLFGSTLIKLGMTLSKAGETSALIRLPFYAAAYAGGVCFLFVCVVLLCDIAKILGGTYE
jgi:TRAP-type C4-dicarboxylate transport system permease small subunit